MEYAVTPKLADPTNIPQDLYGLQRYAGSSLFIDSTLILCSAVCYATLTPLMVRLSILPRIKSVSARNCNCIIPNPQCPTPLVCSPPTLAHAPLHLPQAAPHVPSSWPFPSCVPWTRTLGDNPALQGPLGTSCIASGFSWTCRHIVLGVFGDSPSLLVLQVSGRFSRQHWSDQVLIARWFQDHHLAPQSLFLLPLEHHHIPQ